MLDLKKHSCFFTKKKHFMLKTDKKCFPTSVKNQPKGA